VVINRIRKSVLRLLLSAAVFLVAAASVQAQNTIRLDIGNSPDLLAAFVRADGDPNNLYDIWLAERKNDDGSVMKWTPTKAFKLTKGKVIIHGSTSLNYPERYVFDGQNNKRLFEVIAATGFAPRLKLTGITVQNGWIDFASGAGLYAFKAGRVEVTFCRFKNNHSNQPGAGISLYNTDYSLVLHTVLDGNVNDQYVACGVGQTGNGGGIAIVNQFAAVVGANISNCTIINNKACRGGGVDISGNVNLNLVNSTISQNEGSARGGGLFFHAGGGTNTVRFNTIAFNKAGTRTDQFPRYGGGLAMTDFTGTIKMQGNVLAKNEVINSNAGTLGYTGDDCWRDGGNFFSSPLSTGNIIGTLANCTMFSLPGFWGIGDDNKPFNPLLKPALEVGRQYFGFALPVHIPETNSPTRGNFFPAANWPCESQEERGYPRPLINTASPKCDLGAVELFSDVGL
jgi:hypothetical protein